jgi:ribosomal protein S18 acetylase RimI-like enzyme
MATELVIEIHLATADDAEIIAELNTDVQRIHAEPLPHLFKPPTLDAFPPSLVRELLADPATHIFIGLLDEQPVGYIYAEVMLRPKNSWRYAMNTVYIHHISVKPEYRRAGCGEKLIDAVKDLATEKGITRLALDVWSFNTNAQAFFARQGFTNFNQRMWLEL